MKLLIAAATLVVLALSLHIGIAATPTRVYLPLLSCPTCNGAQPVLPTPTPDPTAVDPVRRELLALVNAARVEAGCPAAREDPLLMQATQEWSVYMERNNVYEHAPEEWYINLGVDYAKLENIGSANSDAQRMVTIWMNSPNHFNNMIYCDETNVEYVIGVGYFDGNWTLNLAWHEPR